MIAQTQQTGAVAPQMPENFSTTHLLERAQLEIPDPVHVPAGIGLALSGGGIRSASFALGVVQHLLNADLWRYLDYVSTVSGGGYLGSALSWWTHQAVSDSALKQATDAERYRAFREQFGSKVLGARTVGQTSDSRIAPGWTRSTWLAFIRQHGNYLRPPGVNILSLAASVLRVCLYSIFVYLAAAVGIFGILNWLLIFRGINPYRWAGVISAVLCVLLLGVVTLSYGPTTWLASTFNRHPKWLYESRTQFRKLSGTILGVVIAAFIVWSVYAVAEYLLRAPSFSPWKWATSSAGLGAIGSAYQFWKGRARTGNVPGITEEVRVWLTATLVIYGLLLSAYLISHEAFCSPQFGSSAVAITCIALGASLVFGLLVNTNFAGIGRLYRDRLMEAFLPDMPAVNENTWALATEADVFPIAALRGRVTREGGLRAAETGKCQRPLQLVNCHVVLIDSEKDIFRTRGGDSFTISSLRSGSNATQWIPTTDLGDSSMTLATAMSISGAAANPNAAPNGHGVTRNRLVSFLMTVFSVGLGYWLPNPAYPRKFKRNRPNLWFPGARQGLLGRGLSERARFIELTDGGHFDNTGVYELVRRRTKLIIVAEAGHDPDTVMDDLANVIEKVRVDFSVFIEFDEPDVGLNRLRSQGETLPSSGVALGRIRYPNNDPTSPAFTDGIIVYLQSVPMGAMPPDVDSYRRRHRAFPSDPTSDQFFDEEALEAYRELGYSIAAQLSSLLTQEVHSLPYVVNVAEILAASTGR